MMIEELRRVVASKPYTTTVARAFRVALDLPLELSIPGRVVCQASYKGIKECFKNYGSPLDHL